MSRIFVGKPFYDYQDHAYFLGSIYASLGQMMIAFGEPKYQKNSDELLDEVDLIKIQEERGALDYDSDSYERLQACQVSYVWDVKFKEKSIGDIRGTCADYEYCEDLEKVWRVYSVTPPQKLLTGENYHAVANTIKNTLARHKNIRYDFSKLFVS